MTLAIRWTQFLLKLLLVRCKVLQKQKSLTSEQTYAALKQVTSIQGLYFTGVFNKEVIETNKYATRGYDRLQNEALTVLPILPLPAPSTRSIALSMLDTRSARWHTADITSDFRLINYDILFLTETQLSSVSDLDEIKNLLDYILCKYKCSPFF